MKGNLEDKVYSFKINRDGQLQDELFLLKERLLDIEQLSLEIQVFINSSSTVFTNQRLYEFLDNIKGCKNLRQLSISTTCVCYSDSRLPFSMNKLIEYIFQLGTYLPKLREVKFNLEDKHTFEDLFLAKLDRHSNSIEHIIFTNGTIENATLNKIFHALIHSDAIDLPSINLSRLKIFNNEILDETLSKASLAMHYRDIKIKLPNFIIQYINKNPEAHKELLKALEKVEMRERFTIFSQDNCKYMTDLYDIVSRNQGNIIENIVFDQLIAKFIDCKQQFLAGLADLDKYSAPQLSYHLVVRCLKVSSIILEYDEQCLVLVKLINQGILQLSNSRMIEGRDEFLQYLQDLLTAQDIPVKEIAPDSSELSLFELNASPIDYDKDKLDFCVTQLKISALVGGVESFIGRMVMEKIGVPAFSQEVFFQDTQGKTGYGAIIRSLLNSLQQTNLELSHSKKQLAAVHSKFESAIATVPELDPVKQQNTFLELSHAKEQLASVHSKSKAVIATVPDPVKQQNTLLSFSIRRDIYSKYSKVDSSEQHHLLRPV